MESFYTVHCVVHTSNKIKITIYIFIPIFYKLIRANKQQPTLIKLRFFKEICSIGEVGEGSWVYVKFKITFQSKIFKMTYLCKMYVCEKIK